jgi:hypothetical protein
VQLVRFTAAGVAVPKQSCTSKQPPARLASVAPGPPSTPVPGSYVGTDDAGTTDDVHEPCTHV